jgi:hypothetical protein
MIVLYTAVAWSIIGSSIIDGYLTSRDYFLYLGERRFFGFLLLVWPYGRSIRVSRESDGRTRKQTTNKKGHASRTHQRENDTMEARFNRLSILIPSTLSSI